MATVGLCENGGPHSIHCLKVFSLLFDGHNWVPADIWSPCFWAKLPFYNIVLCTKSVHVISQEILILYMMVSQTVCPHWGVHSVRVKDQGTLSGPRRFSCKFSREIALVRCPWAKSAARCSPDLGARHLSCKFSHRIALVRSDWAFQARTKWLSPCCCTASLL